MNPLGPIWQAYNTALNAQKVVSRCARLKEIEKEQPFRNTRFYRKSATEIQQALEASKAELEDLTILSLYAAFEYQLKIHLDDESVALLKKLGLLESFERKLFMLYSDWSKQDSRMEELEKMYSNRVGELASQVGTIRKYRNWVAHGRRSDPTPPKITVKKSYEILTDFLRKGGIIR